jgi:methylenetetrahydrofolate--tRNA-(uracil-5-)-methyltransferase
MNINFGLFPPPEVSARGADGRRLRGKDKALAKKCAIAQRALNDLGRWLGAEAQRAAG